MTDNITLPRATVQQALEALNRSDYLGWQLNIPIIKSLRERLAQPEQEFTTHEEGEDGWSDWVCPDPQSYLMKCCDCGLVHEAQFGVVRYASETEREDCEKVDDPNLQAVFRMRRSEQWTPKDTAYRPGGLAQPEQEPQLKRIHPLDIPLEVFVADLSTRPRNVINAEMMYFINFGDEFMKPPFTVRHLIMFSRKELRKWPNLGKRSLNEIEEMLRSRGLQLWDEHDERSLSLLREHPTYYTAPPQQQAEPVNNRIYECAKRLVEYADFKLGGILSADSSAKDIPSNAVSHVKSRHLAALRNSLYTTAPQHPSIKEGT